MLGLHKSYPATVGLWSRRSLMGTVRSLLWLAVGPAALALAKQRTCWRGPVCHQRTSLTSGVFRVQKQATISLLTSLSVPCIWLHDTEMVLCCLQSCRTSSPQ